MDSAHIAVLLVTLLNAKGTVVVDIFLSYTLDQYLDADKHHR